MPRTCRKRGRAALATLRQRGAHTIDVRPSALTVATIQRYLELKSRYL